MQQDIAFLHLIERTLEALDQVMGEFSDETHRITEQEGCILVHDFSGRRIQRGKQLILRQFI